MIFTSCYETSCIYLSVMTSNTQFLSDSDGASFSNSEPVSRSFQQIA
ncbi:hypothetical protein AVDCRST_MAG94-3073 [uncultured Leptolyngbya sp.]|uniref:Uncharacterized protein n=1 Tax=uncultured Leptolyngbya sp. TaxID=332963 RepID=A0A6J4MD27_9CYAN|nr:hypothetical protein AVDCRST_MAG94-3073 [uncultured Leptolyngbya sp.]